uniref:Putative ovule protein n=1 Tax=Solanum chacoense TaxID=4108 RepID=A0A0V0HL58_SOLCH
MELRIKLVLESIFSVFIGSKLLIFCSISIRRFFLVWYECVLMLYYTAFYEITHRPYILEFYIIGILFPSFSHPSVYPHLFCLFCFTT